MKIKSLLIVSSFALASASLVKADAVINITGATAFRSAAVAAIKSSLGSCTYAYDGSTESKQTYGIYKGSLSGVTGNTTIRTFWSGSVEGLRDLSQNNNVTFLPTSTTMTTGGSSNATTTGLDNAKAQLAFSDVYSVSTPYDSGVSGTRVGIIAFRFVASESANGTLTNVTSQNFRNLAVNGYTPAYLFTGNASHTTPVYLTGRNDGSGTRVSVLAETGYGYANKVKQYKATMGAGNTTISDLTLWPTSDTGYISDVYNTDAAANGGYSSGGTVATVLGGTSSSVQIRTAAGAVNGAPKSVFVLSYLGTSDSATAVTAGAVALTYNGVALNMSGSSISNPDVIKRGAYTLWANEQLYWRTGTDIGDVETVRDTLVAALPTNIGSAGVPVGDMTVSRSQDGGLVGE